MSWKRRLGRVLGIRQMMSVTEMGRYVAQGFQAGLNSRSSHPGTETLADVVRGPQTASEGRWPDARVFGSAHCVPDLYDDPACPVPMCSLGCADPLRPRAARCPESECQTGGPCWRCEYEETSHRCTPREDRPC